MPAHAFTPAELWVLRWISTAENWIRRQPKDGGLWRAEDELHNVAWIQSGVVLRCGVCGMRCVVAPEWPGTAVECTVCGDTYLFLRVAGRPPGAST